MEETLYTAGEIARIAGVSLRTIRFYDEKGLLKPVSYSEAGYRYYNQESLAVLQRILMLKYLGFSLQRIEEVMASRNMELQLSEQKELLIQKKRKLDLHRTDGEQPGEGQMRVPDPAAEPPHGG